MGRLRLVIAVAIVGLPVAACAWFPPVPFARLQDPFPPKQPASDFDPELAPDEAALVCEGVLPPRLSDAMSEADERLARQLIQVGLSMNGGSAVIGSPGKMRTLLENIQAAVQACKGEFHLFTSDRELLCEGELTERLAEQLPDDIEGLVRSTARSRGALFTVGGADPLVVLMIEIGDAIAACPPIERSPYPTFDP